MTRYLPQLVEVVGYLTLGAGAFLMDPRLGLVAIGLCLLYEARGASR